MLETSKKVKTVKTPKEEELITSRDGQAYKSGSSAAALRVRHQHRGIRALHRAMKEPSPSNRR